MTDFTDQISDLYARINALSEQESHDRAEWQKIAAIAEKLCQEIERAAPQDAHAALDDLSNLIHRLDEIINKMTPLKA